MSLLTHCMVGARDSGCDLKRLPCATKKGTTGIRALRMAADMIQIPSSSFLPFLEVKRGSEYGGDG
ncbi:hypothetical protein ACS0TY_003457 [Phlomoides rotata]